MRPELTIFLDRVGEGGVSRVACIVANGLAAQGVSVEVVIARSGGLESSLLGADVAVSTLAGRRAARLPRPVATVLALARHLRRSRPRVLLSPGNQTHMVAALAHLLGGGRTYLAVKITNPVVKARHGRLKAWYRRRLYGRIFARASLILLLSRGRVEQLAAMYPAQAGKLRFVHNPYVTPRMLAGPQQEESGEPVILAMGRLAEQKNHALLVRAVARIAHLPWRLVIIGTGPQEARLRRSAAELGVVERVEFLGYVADPTPWLRRATLLALPSRWEDLPAVVLEALACGCPVVATACSDAVVAVVAEADHGAVVPVDDEAAFADAMAAIIEHPPKRRVPPAVLAYGVENGVAEHWAALAPWLEP